ncbi:MAG: amidohydrolase [Xanthomonadales bacterium]|nr:amidohydrolase [Xanthomonadales bacterium]
MRSLLDPLRHFTLTPTFLLLTLAIGLTACKPTASEAPQLSAQAPAQADHPFADSVFLGAAVYTSNPEQAWAEAVAVSGDEIVFVGEEQAARDWIGPETQVLELDGKMLMPGFHDAHAHIMAGGYTLNSCDLQDVRSRDKLYELLQACARDREYGPNDWVLGGHWPLAIFENGAPTKEWLDQVFEGRPAYFVDSFGHNAWVSSKALQLAAIDSLSIDPTGGVIVRDANGQPSGTLREDAMGLVAQHIPAPTNEKLSTDLRVGLQETARFGITSYIEPGIDQQQAEVYQAADRAGWLNARVLASISPNSEAASKFGDEIFAMLDKRNAWRSEHFNVDSVKVYIDGVIETETSFMLQPYLSGKNFQPFYAPAELAQLYQKLDALGLQIHTHAIGDAAIRQALDAYQAMLRANGPNDNRHQIVHLQLIDEADIPRFGELNVAANFQGAWTWPDQYIDVAVGVVGIERTHLFYPVASVQRTGGMLLGGSDWDVTTLDPLHAIEALVRRQDPDAEDGPVLGKDEQIDLETALAMYTRNAAWIMRQEKLTGTLEAGKKADMIVLDRNLFEVPAAQINEAQVELTMMGGKVIHSSEDIN